MLGIGYILVVLVKFTSVAGSCGLIKYRNEECFKKRGLGLRCNFKDASETIIGFAKSTFKGFV